MSIAKTYMRVVFGGKNAPAIGIDQGKGRLYSGDHTSFCLNLFYDNVLSTRDGLTRDESFSGAITNSKRFLRSSIIIEGQNVWSELK